MKVLRGTLTFVLGMIVGIILFVLAIGGTVMILATQITVGNLQKSITGTEVIAPDSELYEKTILDAVKGVISDVQNFDTLSLKVLYEHYGISVLNGISGIDFTEKDFYDVPIPNLVNDLSIIVNSFTLRDISQIAGVNFEDYDLPILTNNLDNNISTAVDNILGTINGDISIRAIKDNFGIDLGINDNDMLAVLQDVNVSDFGSIIDALRLNVLLDADTDTFIPTAGIEYYVVADTYEQVSPSDLANANYVAPLGVETYLAGGIDADGDGKTDTMNMRELRFVKMTIDGADKFVVDNSCYAEGFDASATDKTFYRHVEYVKADDSGNDRYIMSYANHIDITDGTTYSLVQKGFIPVSEATSDEDSLWGIVGTLDKDSKLEELDETASITYKRVHVGSSAALLQRIVYMTVGEIQNSDSLLDSLTVADVIEINEDSAKILKSLAARNTKIKELGEVAGTLPLGEIINITSDNYVQNANGRYVRIVDEDTYTLYDENSAQGLLRYKKNADGTYTQSDKGAFVHSVYYTLYNPAEHADLIRYDRADGDGASSAILQRFTGATLDSFSTAFSDLMLSDVMNIDGDIYQVATPEYISSHGDERFFYYNSEKRVYSVANEVYRSEHPDEIYYHVTISGDSSSFLKKLAYVKVDNMADAMETVIDDMMVSEIIDIYTQNALILTPTNQTSFTENGEYFLEYDVLSPDSGIDERGKYVYAYDDHGVYAKSNFIFNLLPESDVNGYAENDEIKYIYFSYKSYEDLWKEVGENPEAFTSRVEALTSCGNLYYFDKSTSEYTRNIVLCTYLLGHSETKLSDSGTPEIVFPYRNDVFYREAVSATEADGTTVFKGVMYTLKDGVSQPEYGIYIKDNFRGFIPYDSDNPAFADKPIGTFVKSTLSTETWLEYYILRDEVPFYSLALKNEGFISNTSIRYERRRCENVYVLDDNGNFVYVDGQYVEYDPQIHGTDVERFVLKYGYIATSNETYHGIEGMPDVRVTDFAPQGIAKYIRQKSAPVLRMLARGTLGEMTDIISNATVGDVVEAESGSLFALEEIRSAKISEIGKVFSSLLANMTVGNLIEWSNVTDLNNSVKIALDGVSINDLLHSLEYDATHGTIVVNMLKLYGYEA